MILSGGSGTRLWPLSRAELPKQFLPIAADVSLLSGTITRVSGVGFSSPIIVGGQAHRPLFEREIAAGRLTADTIVLEPAARNTAAASGLAAALSLADRMDELLLLLPSDHVINDEEAFVEAIGKGVPHALAGGIVTFGERPSEPSTQYGYIEAEDERGPDGVHRIVRFSEKPDAQTAVEFCSSGKHLWNAGIFLFKASSLLEELERYVPKTAQAVSSAIRKSRREGVFVLPDAAEFASADNISIDYAIMERTDRGFVVPVEMDWSDVGSWSSIWSTLPKDAEHNLLKGDVLAVDTRSSLIWSGSDVRIATLGLENMVIVATSDIILIAPMDRANEATALLAKSIRDAGDERGSG